MDEQEKAVMISVISSARDGSGESEGEMRMMMPGTLSVRSDGCRLCYQETLEDESDHTSITHEVRMLLRPGHVTLLRKGPYGMLMVLDRGKRYEGVYHTPFGDMAMAVYPTVVQCRLGEDGGRVELLYQLDLQGSFASERRMIVEYTVLERTGC